MAILKQHSGQTGAATGSAVTLANSATGGSEFDSVVGAPIQLTGGWINFSSDTAASQRCIEWETDPSMTFAYRIYVRSPSGGATQTASALFYQALNGTSGHALGHNIRQDKKITALDAVGATWFTSAAAITGDVFLDVWGTVGSSSTNGTATVRIVNATTGATIETSSTRTDLNLGTTPVEGGRMGKVTTTTPLQLNLSRMTLTDTASAVGAYTTSTADPVIVSSEDSVYKIDVRSSTKDPTDTLSHAIAYISGPTVSAELVTAGYWNIPLGATEGVWRVTTTASPSGKTTIKDFTVPPEVNVAGYTVRWRWNGSAWA